MKKLVMALLVAGLVAGLASSTFSGYRHDHSRHVITVHNNHMLDWDDDTWFDLDGRTIVISHKERGEPRSVVEITDDYELYIDGERVELNREQQALVREFHEHCMDIVDYAKRIGWEGAKIGVEGAKLGVKAVGCLFKLLLPGYDTDDFEDEIERHAERLEAKAEVLEEKAELIEEMVDDLEDIARDMRRDIPELRALRWF